MKIRFGFVSNSSSTSFCIYGVCLEQSKLQELAERNNIDPEDCDLADTLFDKSGLYYIHEPDGDYLYVGKKLSSMKDDETFGDFKKSVIKILKDIGINDIVCSVLEQSWYDG